MIIALGDAGKRWCDASATRIAGARTAANMAREYSAKEIEATRGFRGGAENNRPGPSEMRSSNCTRQPEAFTPSGSNVFRFGSRVKARQRASRGAGARKRTVT